MNLKITRDADAFICVLYREYLSARKSGRTIEQAQFFEDDINIQSRFFPKWHLEDITHLCFYLEEKGLLDVFEADVRAYKVYLSDAGIVYMESRFPDGIAQVLSTIATLASLVAAWV